MRCLPTDEIDLSATEDLTKVVEIPETGLDDNSTTNQKTTDVLALKPLGAGWRAAFPEVVN